MSKQHWVVKQDLTIEYDENLRKKKSKVKYHKILNLHLLILFAVETYYYHLSRHCEQIVAYVHIQQLWSSITIC